MKIGQTSAIVFVSKLLGSALGFLATLVFARVVGAEVLGIYTLILTVLSWAAFAGELGFGSATMKRISEDDETGAYLSAGLIWICVLGILTSLAIVLAQPLLEGYIAEFDEYVAISVVWVVVLLLFIRLFYKFPAKVLKGERKVHIAAMLDPLKRGGRSALQIALVMAGYSLLGMLVGYAIGGILVGLLGLYFVTIRPTRPSRYHFKSLFDYAKYSWFGKLKSRIFNDIDIIILGVFVSPAAVGVYAVAWSLSKFLDVFGNAISTTLFPEISYTSTQESMDAVTDLVEDSLTYTGLIVIPGVVGGILLAEELMLVYGTEFVAGATVLWILVLAILFKSYQKQFINALNGVDRPDLAFRINVIFAGLNVIFNLALIPTYGIEGAAVASVLSVTVALAVSYYYLTHLVEFSIPTYEIVLQFTSALFMGFVVLLVLNLIEITGFVQQNILVVVMLVSSGAAVYFITLSVLSKEFRATVNRNLPIELSRLIRP